MWNLCAAAMSEFKYACPVCGQHMMCDESQAGTVMDCPTCFQKIVAPQAPAPDSKFILTGTKLTEKKTTNGLGYQPAPVAKKSFPIALVIALVLALAAVGAGIAFRGKLFKPATPPGNVATTDGENTSNKPAKPEKPAVIAPPASDANWSLDLGTNPIADGVAAGRVHGLDFIMERATLSTNGVLTIRYGTKGAADFAVAIYFTGAQAESLSGQSLNVMPDADRAARVQLRWKDAEGKNRRTDYTNGYAMRLEFGALANNKLPGKIYLCTPDTEKSYLLGTFTANTPRPKAPKK
jgi:DNA-directed RNA polymerase subunit RPC12/RpoP